MNRRDFFKKSTSTAGILTLNELIVNIPEILAEQKSSSGSANPAKLPQRVYGKTAVKLSIIGFGGMVVASEEQDHANRLVAEAVEKGVNYFDVAPTYGDAELKLGPALEPYRKNAFLACKTTQRQKEGAQQELKQSLERLKTDHLDLYQLHGIADVKKDVDTAFAKGGAMEVLLDAKKSGQVKYLGFSAHSTEAALTAMDRYDFDSILFPVNFATFYKGNFGPEVIKKATSKGTAILALKALAKQYWPEDHPQKQNFSKCWYEPLVDPKEAELALKFTLSQPVTAAIPPGEESLFHLAMDLAMKFETITSEETQVLRKMAMELNPIFTKKNPA